MPSGAALTDDMWIPTRTEGRFGTGHVEATFSYTTATRIRCKLVERSVINRNEEFGFQLTEQPKAIFRASKSLSPLIASGDNSEMFEVRIRPKALRGSLTKATAPTYRVIRVRNAGGFSYLKEAILERQA